MVTLFTTVSLCIDPLAIWCSVSLTIVTNEPCFNPDANSIGDRHLGTRDRFDTSIQYDYPGKAIGCLAAARMLQSRTLPQAFSTIWGPIVDGNGNALDPVGVIRSSRMPDLKELERGHDAQYLRSLAESVVRSKACADVGEDPFLSDFGKEADITPGTLDAARLAVGAAYDTVDILLQSPNGDNAFGLVWPPGHHAERDLAMGFCYLSNAALAALYARDHNVQLRPGHRNRVVVIDIDHHRGNGTADVLANQADTLLIDVSYRSPYDESRQRFTDGQYDPVQDRYLQAGNEYPYSRPDKDWGLEAHPMAIAPNIISVEFEGEQMPEAIMERFIEEVLPIVRNFSPDLVLWSVGLDSALGDPIGGLGNLPSSFYTMLRGLRLTLPDARHGGLLEGGYDKLRWFTCLPPALLALHENPNDTANRCRAFGVYRKAFTL
jgi:acetoin utilization deacetylase AcuC-like enzyme